MGGHGASPGLLVSECGGAASTVGSPGTGRHRGPAESPCGGAGREAGGEVEAEGRDEAGCLSTAPSAAESWATVGASLAPPLPLWGSGEVEEDREVVEEVLEVEECGEVSEEEEAGGGKDEGGSEWGSEDSSPPAEVEATEAELGAAEEAPAAPPASPAPLPLDS